MLCVVDISMQIYSALTLGGDPCSGVSDDGYLLPVIQIGSQIGAHCPFS